MLIIFFHNLDYSQFDHSYSEIDYLLSEANEKVKTVQSEDDKTGRPSFLLSTQYFKVKSAEAVCTFLNAGVDVLLLTRGRRRRLFVSLPESNPSEVRS